MMTTWNWFDPTLTADDAKARRRELSRVHHPDVGGDLDTMQAINVEYTLFVNWRLAPEPLAAVGGVNTTNWTNADWWSALVHAAQDDAAPRKVLWTDRVGVVAVHIFAPANRLEVRVGGEDGTVEYSEVALSSTLSAAQRKAFLARAKEIACGALQVSLFD